MKRDTMLLLVSIERNNSFNRTFYVHQWDVAERPASEGCMPASDTKKIAAALRAKIGSLAVTNPNASAPEIYEAVRPFAEEHGFFRGKIDATRQIIRKARSAREPQDERWSLSAPSELTDSLIPAEALPVVLSVMRWHLVGGTPFTIRQAKWAARLRGVVQSGELGLRAYALAKLALQFASEELHSRIRGEAFETDRFDVGLAYDHDPYERTTLSQLALEQANQFAERAACYKPLAMFSGLLEYTNTMPDGSTQITVGKPIHPVTEVEVTVGEEPEVLDAVAKLSFEAIRNSLSAADKFNREAFDLVMWDFRRDDPDGDTWRGLSLDGKRMLARNTYDLALNWFEKPAEATFGLTDVSSKWPSSWLMEGPE